MVDDLTATVASQSWDAGHNLFQRIRNARPIPPPNAQHRFDVPRPVTAWMFWEKDGLELIDTEATSWAGRDVLVSLPKEPRSRFLGVWLSVQDVRPGG